MRGAKKLCLNIYLYLYIYMGGGHVASSSSVFWGGGPGAPWLLISLAFDVKWYASCRPNEIENRLGVEAKNLTSPRKISHCAPDQDPIFENCLIQIQNHWDRHKRNSRTNSHRTFDHHLCLT